jgi:hypothetical protein
MFENLCRIISSLLGGSDANDSGDPASGAGAQAGGSY